MQAGSRKSRSRRRRKREGPVEAAPREARREDPGAREAWGPRPRREGPAAPGPAEPEDALEGRTVEPFFLLPRSYDPEGLSTDEPEYGWRAGEQLVTVVMVTFPPGDHTEELDANDVTYEKGDAVVAETDKGLQLGVVARGTRRAMRPPGKLSRVVRRADANDRRQQERNQEKAKVAFALCRGMIDAHSLEMKLVDVAYLHGGNRAVFYFAAEGRVDFRQLVRELGARLHARVEMRQVGVRDAAGFVGGLGPCGLPLCCNSFLRRFAPVSIRMAKDQNLVLNPQKVSGVCGRLMCCLTYEQVAYESARKGLPKVGKRAVLKNGGQGRIRDVDVLARRIRVQLEDGTFVVVGPDDLEPPLPPQGAPRSAPRDEQRDRGPEAPEDAEDPLVP